MLITLIRLLRAQIYQADGLYLTQIKENQAIFLKHCKILHTHSLPLAETIGHEEKHGRITTRRVHFSFREKSWRACVSNYTKHQEDKRIEPLDLF